MGLLQQTLKYKAVRKSVLMNEYGLWVVTYSAAPGVDIAITACQTGITPERAVELAGIALFIQTGQEVQGQ